MKTSDADILVIPGLGNSGPDHWQSRWQSKLANAKRVEQVDWDTPLIGDWVGRIIEAIGTASRPVVLVAHSLGVYAVVHAAAKLPHGMVSGAFLVAAPDLEGSDVRPAIDGGFTPVPAAQLPFPAVLVASATDPYCPLERARNFAIDWHATFVEAGDSGHINAASGHGPWPEGLMYFGAFLKRLGEGVAEK